jgi:curved DNA-binding protein CbpA
MVLHLYSQSIRVVVPDVTLVFVLSVHHPDRHFTSAENLRQFHERRFKDIGEAYSVLNDEAKRLLYDKAGLAIKTSPKKNHKNPPKKPTKNVFLFFFFIFNFL